MTLANHPARAALVELDDTYTDAAALASVPAGINPGAVNVLALPTVRPSPELTRGNVLPSTTDMQRVTGKASTFADMLPAADLDWNPVFATLYANGREVPEEVARAVVRSDTQATVGVVGSRYTIVPHRDLAALGDAVLSASGGSLRVANAGHRQNGARVFMQLESADIMPHAGARSLLTLATSHDGTSTARAGFSSVVIVCRNTYAKAFKDCGDGLVIRHTASALDRLKLARALCEEAAKAGALFDARALAMMNRPFSDDHMRALASHLIPGDSTRAENQRRDLIRAWYRAPGAQPGTVWGAAQAVTYYTSHTVGSPESRADAALFGTGKAADLQTEAWWMLDQPDDVTETRLQSVKVFRA